MYFPYLRGKQFEFEALLEVPIGIFDNTIPIIEPVNNSKKEYFLKLSERDVRFVFITNPFYPINSRLSDREIQTIINTQLVNNQKVIFGYIIDQRFDINQFQAFLNAYQGLNMAIIFRYNPLHDDLQNILAEIQNSTVDYLIFDDRRTNQTTRIAFHGHQFRVLLTDGFQRQERNSDYPPVSAFESNYRTYRQDGWSGLGDYLTIGDHFQEGGGAVFVITLHISTLTKNQDIIISHFSSNIQNNVKGLSAIKFSQANDMLVTSPITLPLNSSGLDQFRDWHNRQHNPQLGAAKKASIMHHIELLSGIV